MQKRLYILFLSMIAATPPLATDMYLPAIPRIARQWGVDQSTVNLSLVLWFVAYSLTLLVWGSMAIAIYEWSRPFLVFGVMATVCPLIVLLLWPLLLNRIRQGRYCPAHLTSKDQEATG